MSDLRKVALWSAALQDHYFTKQPPSVQTKAAHKQRQKWEREAKRRQGLLPVRLPKLQSVGSPSPTESQLDRPILTTPTLNLIPDIALDRAPKITLAQKMGIIEAPKQLLTKSEWEQVKVKAKAQETKECAICCEPFRNLSQVILSCSHSFHKACIQSYERYTNSKRCPLCRAVGYETLLTSEAAAEYYHNAATKIQSTWRMHKLHKSYLHHRKTHEPKHPLLKRKFHMERLTQMNQEFEGQMKEDECEMDQVLREMEGALRLSRDTFEKFSTFYREPEDWDQIIDGVYKRNELPLQESCSICLCELAPPDETSIALAADQYAAKKLRKRNIALLSCGHLLHQKCISNLERFHVGEKKGTFCPVCRAEYRRTLFPY
ncbi:hypothetical protein BCR33DRAFT_718033 [Rhizoclosmatium globosum]|uniref:RING-type domain-containing protein n=1 Tax=Rhizoclosmatium globosum TaxID=329046 RepID=A0A1Y2C719_9FUNG|nr:hypothetical protein BCR33DRAFT_718033 [Rhizoclosmatium globosum]|eukprot:ORY42823.1 hypothetical protein BCR33DRAFT_718033 [Rhizoclosmatium globosum]